MVNGKRMRQLLPRKLRRDIFSNWKSFAAIFLICMLSVMLYCGIDAAWRGMGRNLSVQFEQCGLSQLWITGEISDRMARDIAALPGVLNAQRRVKVRGSAKLPGDPDMDLYMSDGEARINSPMVFAGERPDASRKNACVLDSRFAAARGISAGDTLTVAVDGHSLELYVSALGYSPEYIVYSDGFSFSASPYAFGYAYVTPGTLAFLPYGETGVLLEAGADENTVKEEIQSLLDDPTMLVLTRDDKATIKMAVDEVTQVRALGQVFPAVFFLVAALITFSTMKRLVDNQRMQIGTLCSLGYSHGQLIRHYTSYGLAVSALGALAGLTGARFFLGKIVLWVLKSVYNMPGATLYMHPGIMLGISLLSILIAAGASFASCYHALSEVPAGLLRPKPPSTGRRTLLERIPILWRHLSFSAKLIIRNMLRNPFRFLIGLIGVVGCSALLLTGFGMRDSVMYVLDHHYSYTMRYDVRVDLDSSAFGRTGYPDALKARTGAARMERMMEGSCELYLDGRWQFKRLFVLEDGEQMVHLTEAGETVALPPDGIVLTERASEETGLRIGDTVWLRAPNGRTAQVKVGAVISMQIGQGVYVGQAAWRRMDVMPFTPTQLLLKGGTIRTDAIEDMDGVAKVRTILKEREDNEEVVRVLNVVVLVMAFFAGALLLVVLFTLGQLNFFERIRELATLMVLGFYPRENKRLILTENVIIAILGLPLGLAAGPYLHNWVLVNGLPTILEFIPYIAPESWIYTPVLTILFTLLVNLLIGAKFKKVDMVEALKSVE